MKLNGLRDNTILMKFLQGTPKCALNLYLETLKVLLDVLSLSRERDFFSTPLP